MSDVTEEDAIRVLAEYWEPRSGPLPEGDRFVALPGDDGFWRVNALDAAGRPYAGSNLIVGPDRRLWVFSSNPGIHDFGLVDRTLSALYSEGLQSVVDPDLLAEALQVMTAQRREAERGLIEQAKAGELRARGPRHLP